MRVRYLKRERLLLKTMESSIKLFESKKVRVKWLDQKWYFSVQDVLEILTDSTDIKQYIKKMLIKK